jgi:hypothetical protein
LDVPRELALDFAKVVANRLEQLGKRRCGRVRRLGRRSLSGGGWIQVEPKYIASESVAVRAA